MKKRVFSLFMALALCLSMLPAAAMADTGTGEGESSGSSGETHEHYLCGTSHTCANTQDSEREFTEWTDALAQERYGAGSTAANSLPVDGPASYYLTQDVELTETWKPYANITLCLNGHSIRMKDNKSVISSSGTFTLVDCKGDKSEYGEITHASGSKGHGVELTGGTFTMYGGNITGNNTSDGGGGVYMKGRGTFDMYGGQITGNSTTYCGGGVYSDYQSSNNSTFNMYGGEISDNNGALGGGGVYYGNGTFTMCGGEISGNSGGGGRSKNGGGGVCIVGTMTVSGDVKITGNTEVTDSVSTNNNVYLRGSDAVITIDGALTGGAGSIGVSKSTKNLTAGKSVKIAEGKNYTLTDDDLKAFSSDAGDPYQIQQSENTLLLANTADAPHTHFLCTTDNTCTKVGGHTENGKTTFATKLWMDGDTLMKGNDPWTKSTVNRADGGREQTGYVLSQGEYYLYGDITLSDAAILINGDVKLCLNGHTIDRANETGGADYVIWVLGKDNAHLTLTDCKGTGKLTGGKYGGVDVFGGCALDMFGGTITGNEKNGGVNIGQFGTFNMYGGSITKNSADYGGGVYNGGTFNMYGGEISGNTATNCGGGVYVDSYSTVFKVSGAAKITDNTVNGAANNVYLPSRKTFTLGSHFTKDTYIGVTTEEKPTDKKHVTIVSHAGTMSYDNVVKADDSENYKTQMDGADLVLAVKNGGTTPAKHEHYLCGGDSCTCPVTETKKVEFQPWTDAAKLPDKAGNWYLTGNVTLVDSYWTPADGTVLCLNGYSITMNGSDEAIKVGKNVTFTLTDCKGGKSEYGKITHGTAGGGSKYTDNGVDVSSGGTFNMYGGSIAGNTGTCGGVYMNYATFNMYGGSITENTANNGDGGGVFMRNGTFNMSGGSITGNTTTSIGGGVYVIQGGEFTMSGGSITNNIATENGGGVYVGSVYSVSTGTFAVSGNVNITGNKVGEKLNNVYLYSGRTITIGGELTGKIGVTTATDPTEKRPVTIATAGTDYTVKDPDKNKFTSDKEGYEIKYDESSKTLVLKTAGSDPTPGKVDAGVKITAENANDKAPTEVVYGDTFKLGTTLKTTGTAGSPQSSKWTWSSSDRDVLSVTDNGSAATVKALKVGTATITVTYESEKAIGTATATITVNQRQISVKVDDKEMTVGGALPTFTVTYGNFAFDDTADTVLETKTPSTAADGKTTGSFDITVEAPTIKSNYADKYTVGTPQKGTLTVNAAENPPQPSSGSSSRPSYSVSTPGKTENGSVSADVKNAKKGSTVTITVKPEDGFKLADLTVTDKNGNALALTDKGDGKYTFTMPAGKVEISAAFAEEIETSPFEDVAADAYYYEAVKWAAEQGIAEGTGKGLFGPEGTCTRGQIVTFLWRAAGSPVVNYAMDLADVDEDAYYAEAVRWALSEGVTSGTTDTTFAPDATCTRAQAMTFLFKAMKAAAEGKADFKDVADSDWFASAVAWAVENGVTAGVGGGLFGPDNDCTRGQIVTFLWKLYAGK